MSPRLSFRLSPKPGALTAHTFSAPRSLLTASVASASPSQSSQMMSRSFLPVWSSRSSTGRMSFTADSFLSATRMYGDSISHSIRSGLVTK